MKSSYKVSQMQANTRWTADDVFTVYCCCCCCRLSGFKSKSQVWLPVKVVALWFCSVSVSDVQQQQSAAAATAAATTFRDPALS